jgi:hypothetical protein
MTDILYAAFFLEGEGSFLWHRSMKVCACQVQKWPLERLQAAFGGHMGCYKNNARPNHQRIWRWAVHGEMAAALAMTIYPLMSPRRQGQISTALAAWRAQPTRRQNLANLRAQKTGCRNGHPYDLFTLHYVMHPGQNPTRVCYWCYLKNTARNNARMLAKKRAARLAHPSD